MNAVTVSTQRKKIHPHKFTLWVALGSIIMMFAGLTSAYIVKQAQPEWTTVLMPKVFYLFNSSNTGQQSYRTNGIEGI